MWVTVVVWSLLVMTAAEAKLGPPPLRCQSEDCKDTTGLSRQRFQDGWIFTYKVEGKLLKVSHYSSKLSLDCNNDDVLELRALPVANPAIEVTDVKLIRCPLPKNHSIAEILSVLNVTLKSITKESLLQFDKPPPASVLTTAHFIGLEDLVYLEILGAIDNNSAPISLAPDCLKLLRKLESLKVSYVFATELEVSASLRDLNIDSSTFIRFPVAPALQSLTLKGLKNFWRTLLPCKSLQKIELIDPRINYIPELWLKNCSVLEDLEIRRAKQLVHLPEMLLQDAGSLKRLALAGTPLKELPVGFLKKTPKLQEVDLSSNQFCTLPSDIFEETRQIEYLNLDNNKLESSAIAALAPLVQLISVTLASNKNLGDFCEENGYSPLQNLTKLMRLDLRNTGITRICLDWKHNMTQLENLDLFDTRLINVTFKDLDFKRAVKSTVLLPNTATGAIVINQEDYYMVARGDYRNVTLAMDNLKLQCDCRFYWTRKTFGLPKPLFFFVRAKCPDGKSLEDVPLDSLTCLQPDECEAAGLPEQCQCRVAPDYDPKLIRVHCEKTGLYNVPPLTGLKPDRAYKILLAHNRIAELRAKDIQRNLQELDLRYNLIQTVDKETAKKLQEMDGLLRLGGNQMDCSCNAVPLLRALHARNESLTDLNNATCIDGSLLLDAAIIDCPNSLETVGTWLAGVFAVVVMVMVIGVKFFWSQQRRFFARAVLHRWGVRWGVDEPADDDREYDAFLTFSHRDNAVARAVLIRLEPQYRFCVHLREWTPGELIPAQITKSVRESRRTVALVSRHFLESKWARAEFREAHTASMLDARPRLVVVLLEEPGALQMDDELRRYIATRTYLRWGESLFWHKLALALPRPRTLPYPPPVMELLPLPSDNPESGASELLFADAGMSEPNDL